MCWASAALPPLPASKSLLPARKLAAMTSAIFRAVSSRLASEPARSSASRESFRCAAIGSFKVGLKRHHFGYVGLGNHRTQAVQAHCHSGARSEPEISRFPDVHLHI